MLSLSFFPSVVQTQISHFTIYLSLQSILAQKCANKYNVEMQILVGDGDSATVKKVGESVTHNVGQTSTMLKNLLQLTCILYYLSSKGT